MFLHQQLKLGHVLTARGPGCDFPACLVLAGLVSAAVAAAKRGRRRRRAAAGSPTAQNDLVLDEVGTALNLVARATRHDRHRRGRVLRCAFDETGTLRLTSQPRTMCISLKNSDGACGIRPRPARTWP